MLGRAGRAWSRFGVATRRGFAGQDAGCPAYQLRPSSGLAGQLGGCSSVDGSAAWRPDVSKRVGLLARKVGMMNLWESDGRRLTATVLCVDRCHVLQVKDPQASQRHPFYHIQVGAGPKRPYQVKKPQRYHFASAGVEPKEKSVEFSVTPDALLNVGTELRVDHFAVGQFVDVTGTSVGKGFQGPMKRWGFGGLAASHGVSKAHRSHGSTGNRTEPGRVFKGKKMAGRMGGKRRTVQSLEVIRLDSSRNLIYVCGHVPGNPGNWVRVFDAVKKARVQPVLPPFPTFNFSGTVPEGQIRES